MWLQPKHNTIQTFNTYNSEVSNTAILLVSVNKNDLPGVDRQFPLERGYLMPM